MALLTRLKTRCILTPAEIPPSRPEMEVIGTFNPAAAALPDGSTVLLVRVAERPREVRPGFHAAPRYTPDGDIAIDWIADDQVTVADPRMLAFRDTGFKRLTFTSHLRVVFLEGGGDVKRIGRVVESAEAYASFGWEDPRLTRLDGQWYVTVVGASPHGVNTCLLRASEDFEDFEDMGIIFCRENKDVVLFPEKIGGRYVAITRPTGNFQVQPPEMWMSRSRDLRYWGDHRPLFGSFVTPKHPAGAPLGGQIATAWDNGRVGGGVPPFRTDRGWLKIYHASCRPEPGEPVGLYAAGALLLDGDDPSHILARSPEAFMRPEADFERQGFVKAVVFPTGHRVDGDDLTLFYGAADQNVGMVRYSLTALLDSLVPYQPGA